MRPKASAIYQALSYIKDNIRERSNTLEQLKAEAVGILTNSGFDKVDYIEICDADLQVLNRKIRAPMVALIAATLDNVRLIDNLVID
jgi:pantoate--beta-alanine ligase